MSTGAFGMMLFDLAYDSWCDYRKDLKAAKCDCKRGEEE